MLQPIEKAVQASGLGLNPQNDGNQIRLPILPLSEEWHKELFKKCREAAEETKVALRLHRQTLSPNRCYRLYSCYTPVLKKGIEYTYQIFFVQPYLILYKVFIQLS